MSLLRNTVRDAGRRGITLAALIAFGFLTLGMLGQISAAEAQVSEPWQMGFQKPVTPVAQELQVFHDYILFPVITVISIFVMVLLAYTMWRFSEKRNPNPSKTTHNTLVEVVWTVVPIIILVAIAVPSFRLLYNADVVPESDMTLKVVGRLWYWSYTYPDHGGFEFDSRMKPTEDLKKGEHRLLEVDNRVVLPSDTTIRVQMTASEVIHNWAIPSFAQKTDTVPGRLNESWIYVGAEHEGVYYGQCSELCGAGHAYMPIAVEIVSKKKFEEWVEQKQAELLPPDRRPKKELASRQ